jgi:peptide deformylase
LAIGQEGCLSVPQVFMDVKRPAAIMVAFKDAWMVNHNDLEVDGLLARVIQHEIDHLNGVMFVDYVQNAIALKKELDKHGFSVKDVQPIR